MRGRLALSLTIVGQVNANCVSFKDETVVNIINMAGDIYSYAQRVAGHGASYCQYSAQPHNS